VAAFIRVGLLIRTGTHQARIIEMLAEKIVAAFASPPMRCRHPRHARSRFLRRGKDGLREAWLCAICGEHDLPAPRRKR
jgi:hypothetical protein